MTDIKERQQITEADYAMEQINDALPMERVFAAGCALYGIARGLNVPDETRTAIIAVADWLKMSGWESCQPEPTGALNPAPKVYAKRLVTSPFFTKGKEYEVIAEFDNGDFVVNDNRGKRYQVPWRDYHDVWQRVEYVARGELTGRSYTPYNKGDEPPDENTCYNSVAEDVIGNLVSHALETWDNDEIHDRLYDRLCYDMDRTYTDDELIEFAAEYSHKLCKDINGNWVLIPEEN